MRYRLPRYVRLGANIQACPMHQASRRRGMRALVPRSMGLIQIKLAAILKRHRLHGMACWFMDAARGWHHE
jgi:hypothetical protein